jgi:membrane associated rhomboid family serine protease
MVNLFRLIKENNPVTYLLMLIMALFSGISFYSESFFLKMILHPFSIVKKREYYRLITADLVHNNLMHLLLNEVMLFFVCGSLEKELRSSSEYGSEQYMFIYLLSLFAGTVVTTMIRKNEFGFSSAGTSGSILGCLFSLMIIKPNDIAFYLPFFGGLKNRYTALMFIIILIWHQQRKDNKYMSHELHFFGALGGILATLLLFHHKF